MGAEPGAPVVGRIHELLANLGSSDLEEVYRAGGQRERPHVRPRARIARRRERRGERLAQGEGPEVGGVLLPVASADDGSLGGGARTALPHRFVGGEGEEADLPLLDDSEHLGPVSVLGLPVDAVEMVLVGDDAFLHPRWAGQLQRVVFQQRCSLELVAHDGRCVAHEGWCGELILADDGLAQGVGEADRLLVVASGERRGEGIHRHGRVGAAERLLAPRRRRFGRAPDRVPVVEARAARGESIPASEGPGPRSALGAPAGCARLGGLGYPASRGWRLGWRFAQDARGSLENVLHKEAALHRQWACLGPEQREALVADGRVYVLQDDLDLPLPGTVRTVERNLDQGTAVLARLVRGRPEGGLRAGRGLERVPEAAVPLVVGRRTNIRICPRVQSSLVREDALAVEGIRRSILDGLFDCCHRVLDKLAPGHLLLDICQVQIGIQEHDRVAYGMDHI